MAELSIRIVVLMAPDMVAKIDEPRWRKRLASRGDAIRELCEKALEAEDDAIRELVELALKIEKEKQQGSTEK